MAVTPGEDKTESGFLFSSSESRKKAFEELGLPERHEIAHLWKELFPRVESPEFLPEEFARIEIRLSRQSFLKEVALNESKKEGESSCFSSEFLRGVLDELGPAKEEDIAYILKNEFPNAESPEAAERVLNRIASILNSVQPRPNLSPSDWVKVIQSVLAPGSVQPVPSIQPLPNLGPPAELLQRCHESPDALILKQANADGLCPLLCCDLQG